MRIKRKNITNEGFSTIYEKGSEELSLGDSDYWVMEHGYKEIQSHKALIRLNKQKSFGIFPYDFNVVDVEVSYNRMSMGSVASNRKEWYIISLDS
jgi:hypothetical protein